MINISEFREKSIEDLKKELQNFKKDLQNSVSDILQKKEKNVRKASAIKKDIARIETLLNEKLKKEEK
jgi:ribosomal protein L29